MPRRRPGDTNTMQRNNGSVCFGTAALLALLFLAVAPETRAGDNTEKMYRDASRYVHEWNRKITDVIVDEEGRTPCTIGRIYAYANVAAYEAAVHGFPKCRSLDGQLVALRGLPQPEAGKTYDWRVTSIAAYYLSAQKLLYNYTLIDSMYGAQLAEIRGEGVPAEVIDRSVAYGEAIASSIVKWGSTDGLKAIQAREKYTFPKDSTHWAPTPPLFNPPVDPFWYTMRPFTLDSVRQYPVDPPVQFSTDHSSQFYKNALEVYNIGRNLTEEEALVAGFWDCNPIHANFHGHFAFNTRQISPAGHWINITAIACRQKNLDMMESAEAYTLVSLALADGFLSCWAEKYRSNGIRPITYIQRYIDSTWKPNIQTPPFPEHSSGHSTISAAAATVLMKLFGPVPFDDDTETYLGMPIRRFNTFMEAAQEAAMSRLYGGIHFRHGNEAGTRNGKEIGEHVMRRIKTRA